MSNIDVQLSKFLSLILRHQPETIGIVLDSHGWANISELITKSNAAGKNLSHKEIEHVVETNDKKRFIISNDGLRIRAAQGHSLPIEIEAPAQEPPKILYHGTAAHLIKSIMAQGLKPGARKYVHLSINETTAYQVGQRHGKPAIILIEALCMHAKGYNLLRADNGVWLTNYVPPEFLALTSSKNAVSAITSKQPKLST